jgi:lambda repressor-like predicted transcriptional regulator
MRSNRLPAAPARRAIAVWVDSHRLDLQDLAEVLHLPRHELRLLLGRPWLTWETADAIAVALGRHPFEIWPGWFDTFPRPAGEAGPGKGELDDGCHADNEFKRSSAELTHLHSSTRSKEGQR